jgi:hypothetical protein
MREKFQNTQIFNNHIFSVTGFTILFMLMYPVPRQVKVAFHIFGLICFIESLVHIGLTAQASDCVRLYNYFILYVFIHTVEWV